MKYIVTIPPPIEEKIRSLISKGEFRDVNHFITVALENQINAEENSATWITESPKQMSHVSEEAQSNAHFGPSLVSTTYKTCLEPQIERLNDRLLWGQYYRFLPTKFALRILANLSTDKFPTLASFKDHAVTSAETFGKQLKRLDRTMGNKSGEKISTSFPESNEKSRKRFTEQYIGYVRSTDQKYSGMLLTLRFADVLDNNGIEEIGITPTGQEFCNLQNPIIDGQPQSKGTFSLDEIDFLVHHIGNKLPDEARHMMEVLDLLRDEGKSREALNSALRLFYKKYQDSSRPWTEGVVNLMRAGVMSRMFELELISKKRNGLRVTYELTELGKKYTEMVSNIGGT
jgi:Arc/MetJ-type ribon-helix-helix transcriptional regulator